MFVESGGKKHYLKKNTSDGEKQYSKIIISFVGNLVSTGSPRKHETCLFFTSLLFRNKLGLGLRAQ